MMKRLLPLLLVVLGAPCFAQVGLVNNTTVVKPSHYSDTQPFPKWVGITVTRAANVVTASVTSDPTIAPRIIVNNSKFLTKAENCVDSSFDGEFMATAATTGPDEVKWSQTGANASTTCDVRAKRLQMPAVNDFWINTVFGNAEFHRITVTGAHDYATKVPFNADNTKFVYYGGTLAIRNVTDYTNTSDYCVPGGSLADNVVWSRIDANKLFRTNGKSLQYRDVSTPTCGVNTIKTFTEYDSLSTNNEGIDSPDGQYLPLAGVLSGNKEPFCYDWQTDTKTAVTNIGGVFLDNNHCFSDGSMLINFGAVGPRINAAQRISATVMKITLPSSPNGLVAADIVVGKKVRVLGGQFKSTTANETNGLWTICDSGTTDCLDPTTTVLYVTGTFAVDFGTISGAVNGWELSTERRGVIYVLANGTVNNIIATNGAHGQVGELSNGKPVWVNEGFRNVGRDNPKYFAAPCTPTAAGLREWVAKADWPADNTDDRNAAVCAFEGLLTPWAQGGHMSVMGNWMMYSMDGCQDLPIPPYTGTRPNMAEATLYNDWPTAVRRRYCPSTILVRTLDLGDVYEIQTHTRNPQGASAYNFRQACAFSQIDAGRTVPKYLVCRISLDGSTQPLSMLIPFDTGAAGVPNLTGIAPTEGEQGTSPAITLTGFNLGGTNPVITISGTGVTSDTPSCSATSCTANLTITGGAEVSLRDVRFTSDDGGPSNPVSFSVTSSSAPTLSAVSPDQILVGATVDAVTLTGTNFDASATIAVSGSGVTCNVVSVQSSTTIVASCTATDAAALTARNMTVTTTGGTSGSQTYTVRPRPGINLVPSLFLLTTILYILEGRKTT